MKRCRLNGKEVPGEVEEQILLKLPVKSLIRFKSVSKGWKSLISDDRFVKEHLAVQASKPPSSMLLGLVHRDPLAVLNDEGDDVDLDKKQVLYLLTVGDSIAPTVVKDEIYLPIRPTLPGDGNGALVSLDGFYCNGIVCLVDRSPYFSHRILFYNPALREHTFTQTPVDFDLHFHCSGFGHDRKNDDYKFIRLLGHDPSPMVSKAEVYSLQTGSWKVIKLDTRWRLSGDPGVYLDGRLYWQNYVGEDVLVWFDVSDERFGKIDLPQPRNKWTDIMKPLVWKGSLAFFHNVNNFFEMWLMDGEAGGWSRYYRIGLLRGIAMPIAFWKEDELLMEAKDGCVVSYNFATKDFTRLPLPIQALPHSPFGGLYSETLVSVKTRF